ncbi:MAG: glycosyltransferase [Puniceicoccales bacterium]|jgi:glycosyltransferase involved in cell wall biosynthesis|nr:glycosyltransferase [Puniceicoccales bacterium]
MRRCGVFFRRFWLPLLFVAPLVFALGSFAWRARPPIVSVLMPVYNGEAHLRRALESACEQTLKRIEIICVDDGSTDGTAEILRKMARDDGRISVLRNEVNRGTLYSRIRAVEASRGRYILWLDADDELFPDIARLASRTAAKRRTDCVHFCSECAKCGVCAPAGKLIDPAEEFLEKDELLPSLAREKSVWYLWNKLFSAKAMRIAARRLGPYAEGRNIVYVEDLPLLWNAWKESRSCVGIRAVGYRHYVGVGVCNSASTTASCAKQFLMDSAKVTAILVEQERGEENFQLAQDVRLVAAKRFLPMIQRLPSGDGIDLFRSYMAEFPDEMQFEIFSAMLEQFPAWATVAATAIEFPRRAERGSNGKISLLLRIPTLAVGGVERVVSLLANHWASDPRYDVTVAIDKDAAITFPTAPNVRVVRISPASSGHSHNADIYALAKKIPMDACICINYGNWYFYPMMKFIGVPVCLQEHNFYFRSVFLDRGTILWRKLAYAGCAAVSCLSSVDLYRWRRDGVRNSLVLNNPLTFDPESVVMSDQNNKNVLWIGRWTEDAKRPHLTIEAFSKVLKRVPDAKLLMIGMAVGKDREYKERCERMIEDLAIEDSVTVLSFRDVEPYLRNGALLMMSSSIEGAPMVIVEAKAHGLPVAMMELKYVEVAKAGCIQTPKNDVDALADAVSDLLEDRQRRIELGLAGADDVRKNYSNRATFKKYEKLIDAMIAGPAAVADMCESEWLPDALEAECILDDEEQSLRALVRSMREGS